MTTPNSRRTTLITGASRGLGAAIALEQGAVGSNVAVNYFNSSDAAEQLCQRILQTGGYAHPFKADVRSEAEIVRLVREVTNVFGGIDVLVINATGPSVPLHRRANLGFLPRSIGVLRKVSSVAVETGPAGNERARLRQDH